MAAPRNHLANSILGPGTRGRHSAPPGPARQRAGFTLFEVLITIGLAAVLLTIYSVLLSSTIFLRRSLYNVQAANFIQEELDSLRTLPYAELLNRSEGNFLDVPLQRGRWRVQTATTDTQGNRLVLNTPVAALIEETGLIILPGNWRGDFNCSAKIKVDATSAAGWNAGILFRYRDAENHYRLRYSAGGLALDKVYHGTRTTIWSQSTTLSAGIWYTLEVDAVGNSFTLKKDGATLTTHVDAENYILNGDLGLASINGAKVAFDDVSVTENAVTTTWDFTSYALGELPASWMRLSWYDLPNGQGKLTIDNYLTESAMKQATATVRWTDNGQVRSASGSTVIGN